MTSVIVKEADNGYVIYYLSEHEGREYINGIEVFEYNEISCTQGDILEALCKTLRNAGNWIGPGEAPWEEKGDFECRIVPGHEYEGEGK